jgi:hypothetical protein
MITKSFASDDTSQVIDSLFERYFASKLAVVLETRSNENVVMKSVSAGSICRTTSPRIELFVADGCRNDLFALSIEFCLTLALAACTLLTVRGATKPIDTNRRIVILRVLCLKKFKLVSFQSR